MLTPLFRGVPPKMLLTVKTTPNSPQTAIKRFENDILYVAVAAPAEKGQANDTLIRFLAKLLKTPASEIKILSGQTARLKKIKLPIKEDVFKKLIGFEGAT